MAAGMTDEEESLLLGNFMLSFHKVTTHTPKKCARPSHPRSVYLATYSQADLVKVPSRKHFAEMVQVRENIKRIHDIDLDFSEWHDNYYSVWTYVTKCDAHFQTSEGHPPLSNPPITAMATAAKRANACRVLDLPHSIPSKKAPKPFKPPRLTNEGVGQIILKNQVKNEQDLYCLAKLQAKEGKSDLQNYLYKHPNSKMHADLISTVWKIEAADMDIARQEKSRIEILEDAKLKPCSEDPIGEIKCNGSWLAASIDIMHKNSIDRKQFSDSILNCLKHGRGKGRNVMIVGPTNSAKSFILMPLTKIYTCFMTP